MIRYILILILLGHSAFSMSQEIPKAAEKIKYYDNEYFLIEGTSIAGSLKESPYDRFPISYKDKVRKPVWDLSKASAGLSVRFLSNSTSIRVKWALLNNSTMNHMAETGIKGIDLYCKVDGQWKFVNTARPTGKENDVLLINKMSAATREYKMFLPLYDGVTKLEIGIDALSKIEKPVASEQLPIVFYGTSITQGGCASRPGMAYTNIISRKLNVDCVNFGFSGNGRMETPVCELMSQTDASFYVIDCISNMELIQVQKNVMPLVEIIRSKHPNTPIVFVEGMLYSSTFLNDSARVEMNTKNKALKNEYEKLLQQGISNIVYIDNIGAIGFDNEATVDGVHFTDLGFMRFSDYLISKFDQSGLKIAARNKK